MEEKKNTMENLTKSTKAIKTCAEWLSFCLSIGWDKEQLDELEKIWWEHHDEKGNLTSSGSVAAPKEETLKQAQIDYYENKLEGMFRNQADQETELASLRQQLKEREEALKESRNKLLSLGDKHFIIDEITALREALKDLLPIAEEHKIKVDKSGWKDEYFKIKAIIEKARNLISK